MVWWLKREVHSAWRVALACLLFVVGVSVAPWLCVPAFWGIVALPVVVCLLCIRPLYALIGLAFCALLVGLGYGALYTTARSVYGQFIGRKITIQGVVKEDISRSASGGFSVQLHDIVIEGQKLSGTVLVSARSVGAALRGDRLTIEGVMREGFGSFPASLTMNRLVLVERSPHGDIGRLVRDWFADAVRRVIPEPQASLGVGYLTGQKSALPPDLSEALKIAGLTHIVVASGYNLTILVRLARKVFLKVSKYLSAITAAVMIIAFVSVTGLSPSMTRAGLVSGMSLLSWYYGHVFHPFVLLPVAAAITVVWQPSYVWGDLGWQLSFAAFVGVMIVAPLLQTYFFGNKVPGILRQVLGETVAAHIVTVPLIALSFGTISNVAIIANLLVVPLVPLAMLLTFLCGVGALLAVPFIELVAVPTTWLLGYMTNVATFVAELPWAQSQFEVGPLVWIGYLGLLASGCWWMWRKTSYTFQDGKALQC